MAETMIRTQVYLPRNVYVELQIRAKARKMTMAVQIREALEDYLRRSSEAEDDSILHPDDPIFQLAGVFGGPADLSANHDHYLYGLPETRAPVAVRERVSANYGRRAKLRKRPKKQAVK